MRRRLIVFAVSWAAAALLVDAGSGAMLDRAAQPAGTCSGEIRSGVKCLHVSVPLDWSGAAPGKVSLRVAEYVAPKPRGVMFLLAGGPGQPSSEFFYLGRDGLWQRTFPGYTLVAFDPRGTGGSDPLRCRPAASSDTDYARINAACAHELGTARNYYRTVDNAMDIDGVRKALGFRRIGIYGASYGTDLALTYAHMFPAQTTRLLLDSVAGPYNDLSLVARIAKAIPQTLRTYCAHACVGPTRNYASDAISLANSLAAKPLRGRVLQSGGGRRLAQLTAIDFLDLVVESDLNPGIAAELPAAVEAERHGDATPLLRLEEFVSPAGESQDADPVHTATVCDDGPFPWRPDTPIAARPALLESALASVPSSAYGKLGSWASAIGGAPACLDWPVSSVPAPTIPAAYPNVPVLAIAGDLDLRAPTFEARNVIRHFPRGHLLTVANTGHAPLADSESPCLTDVVKRWLRGARVPASCAARPMLAPIAALPHGKTAGAARTLARVLATIREAEATWDMTGTEESSAGLEAGKLTSTDGGFDLYGYRVAPGISAERRDRLEHRRAAVELRRGRLRERARRDRRLAGPEQRRAHRQPRRQARRRRASRGSAPDRPHEAGPLVGLDSPARLACGGHERNRCARRQHLSARRDRRQARPRHRRCSRFPAWSARAATLGDLDSTPVRRRRRIQLRGDVHDLDLRPVRGGARMLASRDSVSEPRPGHRP